MSKKMLVHRFIEALKKCLEKGQNHRNINKISIYMNVFLKKLQNKKLTIICINTS